MSFCPEKSIKPRLIISEDCSRVIDNKRINYVPRISELSVNQFEQRGSDIREGLTGRRTIAESVFHFWLNANTQSRRKELRENCTKSDATPITR